MKSTKQAIENMEYVRRLLEQKQPGFAASLEFAASLVETAWKTDGRTDPAVRGGGPRSLPADDSAVPEGPARQRRTGSTSTGIRSPRWCTAAARPGLPCTSPDEEDGGVVPEVCPPRVRHAQQSDGAGATMV